MKACKICGTTLNIPRHRIFGGSNRQISERYKEYGFVVYLCAKHHNASSEGVHYNKALDLKLKQEAQKQWERTRTREEFIQLIGRNYL